MHTYIHKTSLSLDACMTTLSALLTLCERIPSVTCGFPSQRASNTKFCNLLNKCWTNSIFVCDLGCSWKWRKELLTDVTSLPGESRYTLTRESIYSIFTNCTVLAWVGCAVIDVWQRKTKLYEYLQFQIRFHSNMYLMVWLSRSQKWS